jgi:serine protease Do
MIAPIAVTAFVLGLLLANQISFAQPKPVAAAPATPATDTPVPMVTPDGESPFVSVAEHVIPAVVNISAETPPDSNASVMPPDFFKGFPFQFQFPTPAPQPSHSLGSGVIISADGYIVTNNHVVAGADKITVTLPDKTQFKNDQVKVIGADPVTDIALLKVDDSRSLPYVEWGNSDSVKVGDWAIAVGNPFGLNGTVTVGVISAKGRSGIPLEEGPRVQDFIQTDASINPGNSGGPLVNIRGQIIAINSAIRSPVGASVGIGFAVPAAIAREVTDELRTTGKIVHGYLGIVPQDVTESVKDAMGLENTEGVLVGQVQDNTPAKKAGILVGDVITDFDGQHVTDVAHFRSMVAAAPPDKTVKIDLVRDGKKKTVDATLGAIPTGKTAAVQPAQPKAWHGLRLENLNASDREQLKAESGVVVRSVEPGSAAEDAGLQAGDVITKIVVKAKDISEPITSMSDFNSVADKLEGYTKAIAIQIQRGTATQIVTLTPESKP